MADYKTNLRELSVLVGIINLINKNELVYSCDLFFNQLKTIIPFNEQIYIRNLNSLDFNENDISIIKNGYKLANEIIKKFKISKIYNYEWLGYKIDKDNPVDLIINDFNFSLKEDSFILENMGLYKFVNLLTNKNHLKLHIFEDFAMKEYNEWFEITWKLLNDYLKI
jgi:hypothetical protein